MAGKAQQVKGLSKQIAGKVQKGFGAGAGGVISSRIASNTTLNCRSYFDSRSFSGRAISRLCPTRSRSRTKARMISTLTRTACLLFSTEDSMATPCSVKA